MDDQWELPSVGGRGAQQSGRSVVTDENSGRAPSDPCPASSAASVGDTLSPQMSALIAQCVEAAIRASNQSRKDRPSGSASTAVAGSSGVQAPRVSRDVSPSVSSDEESVGGRSQGSVVSELPESIGIIDHSSGFDLELTDLVAAHKAQPTASQSTPSASGRQSMFDMVKEDWGELYNTEEKFGPPVSPVLADLVNAYVRSRSGEIQLRKATDEVLIPDNCKGLTVPKLNPEFVGAFAYKHGIFLERQLCRQVSLNCKAVGPLLRLLDAYQSDPALPVDRLLMKGVSDSVRLLISTINLQNFTRKQNVMNCVRDQHLRPLCDWATPVGETLFPADVSEQVAAVKRKYKIAGGSTGSQKGAKRHKRNDYTPYSQRGGAKGQYSKGSSSCRGGKKPQEPAFLGKGSKGKEKSS